MGERYTTSTSFQEPHIPGASPLSLNLNRATTDLQTSWESYNNTLLASYLVWTFFWYSSTISNLNLAHQELFVCAAICMTSIVIAVLLTPCTSVFSSFLARCYGILLISLDCKLRLLFMLLVKELRNWRRLQRHYTLTKGTCHDSIKRSFSLLFWSPPSIKQTHLSRRLAPPEVPFLFFHLVHLSFNTPAHLQLTYHLSYSISSWSTRSPRRSWLIPGHQKTARCVS